MQPGPPLGGQRALGFAGGHVGQVAPRPRDRSRGWQVQKTVQKKILLFFFKLHIMHVRMYVIYGYIEYLDIMRDSRIS